MSKLVVFEGTNDWTETPSIPAILKMAGKPDVHCIGMIDTGSPHCVVNQGLLPDDWFINPSDVVGMRDARGNDFNARGAQVNIKLHQVVVRASFPIRVYEMPIGSAPPGVPVMLIGRSLLKHGMFIYDGIKGVWSLSFDQSIQPPAVKE